jgi:hypothetical protein
VSRVRHEDVFREHGTEQAEAGDERCAYLLFYCRNTS